MCVCVWGGGGGGGMWCLLHMLQSSEPEWANPTLYEHWKLGSYIQTIAIFGLVSDFCALRELKIVHLAIQQYT